MKCSEFVWNDVGYILVYGGIMEECSDFVSNYIMQYIPEMKQTMDAILRYKKGFLQKEKTVVELLTSLRPRNERTVFAQRLKNSMHDIGLGALIYRTPKMLSYGQRFSLSCLYMGLVKNNGRFIVYDDGTPNSYNAAARMATWLRQHNEDWSIVWVSAVQDEGVLFKEIFPYDARNGLVSYDGATLRQCCREFWRMENGELFRMNESEMDSRHDEWINIMMCHAIEFEKNGHIKEALDIFEELISMGNKDAGLLACYIYSKRLAEGDGERAYELAKRFKIAEFYLEMGDSAKKRLLEVEAEKTSNTKEKQSVMLKHLGSALYNYRSACACGSIRALYEVGKLCFKYIATLPIKDDYGESTEFKCCHKTGRAYFYKIYKIYTSTADEEAMVYLVDLIRTNPMESLESLIDNFSDKELIRLKEIAEEVCGNK